MEEVEETTDWLTRKTIKENDRRKIEKERGLKGHNLWNKSEREKR